MFRMSRTSTYLAFALALTAVSSAAEELERADPALPEAGLLDVGIHVFDAGLLDDFEPLRDAEARYVPVHLARTLETTGFWGVVRIVPEARNVDLNISGALLRSNGAELRLRVRVVDAFGKVWLDKKYKKRAEDSVRARKDLDDDRFQVLYNEIANDIYRKRRKLHAEDVHELRTVSRLRFAVDLAPSIFTEYLEVKKTRYSIVRLPARDDPMMARVDLIRTRDGMFIEMLDTYYRDFYTEMKVSYSAWRASDYWKRETIKNVGRYRGSASEPYGAGGEPFIGGPVYVRPSDFRRPSDDSDRRTKKIRELHFQALRQLGESLASDVEPRLVEVEGRVLHLMGTVEAQYAAWRQLLREIFAAETGLPIITRP